ncbi:SDR family NAD(P)-dependent oxidoreductase [Sphingobacterium bambusae]|uniref:SDR family NAD(P)-dependent oxidoreductase n=1 Tax=Sphingobacterium bambusae TaxID=662858 RepID=A0ABW6BC07_9SPHI|nr:SDR family NAD(P)-dependent oxidoreductase [Sphingobacterium bambusae]WPL48884.1 SDR family NAD(P)-dependent oxidoreductase [Sphingobacterium bambusae]
MSKKKVWFITGASKGMGLEVAKAVLANGDMVIATSRSLDEQIKSLGTETDQLLPLTVDVTNEQEVQDAVGKGIEKFGQIDVVLNNAGYYLVGSLEEISDLELRKTMDVNVFGMVNVIRNVMPYLRRQRSGHVINISSNMGYIGYANTGSYNASKFAVIGLSEALAQEVKPFGIHVTVIAPGMFRNNFMSDSTLAVAARLIPDYHVAEHINMLKSFDGHQPGDPTKLAKVLIDITELPTPPLHLPLGTDSYQSIVMQRVNETTELETWKHLSFSTDF